jgi:uncharacterized protein (UPF0332 family)
VSPFWDKAREMGEEARVLLRSGHFNGAANRAYYAMFNAARAVLEARTELDVIDVRRHSAALKLFSQHIVKTGLVDRELNAAVNEAFEVRAIADYDRTSVSEKQAMEMVALMERMIAALTPLIQAEGKS